MNNQDAGRLYGWLYDKGTAAALVCISGLLLAVGQTRTIVDAVGLVHPGWSPVWAWVVAVGFETAILSVGLVMAGTGDRDLWRWEVVLVGASVAAGLAVGLHDKNVTDYGALVRAAAMGLLPVQYLAVVLTGHKLAKAAPDPGRRRPVRASDASGLRPAVDGDRVVHISDNGTAWGIPGGLAALSSSGGRFGRAVITPPIVRSPAVTATVRTETADDLAGPWTVAGPFEPAKVSGGLAAGVLPAVKRRGRPPGPSRPEAWAAALADMPAGLSVADSEAWLSERLGVSSRTVRRWRSSAGA